MMSTTRIILFHTAPSCPPLSLRSISPHTPTTMHLTWNPPQMSCRNGIIIRYTVRICRESTIPCRTVTSSSTSTTVGELQPYYYYEVSVAAYTVGEGPQSVRRLTTQQNSKRKLALYRQYLNELSTLQ